MRILKTFLFLTCLTVTVPQQAHIHLFTIVFNRPEFISLQKKTLDMFLLDDWDWTIYNNAMEPDTRAAIEEACEESGIPCVTIPLETDPYPQAHGEAMNFALKDLLSTRKGKLLLFENDDFLIQPLSIELFMQNCAMGFIPHSWGVPLTEYNRQGWRMRMLGEEYLYAHPNVVYFNMDTLPNIEDIDMNKGPVDDYYLDSGGRSCYYLRDHPEIETLHIDSFPSWDVYDSGWPYSIRNLPLSLPENYKAILEPFVRTYGCHVQFNLQSSIMHYGGGSNWDNRDPQFHEKKWQAFIECIESLLQLYRIAED